MPVPLPPPPPPLPAAAQAPASGGKSRGIPPQCHPNAESLMHLANRTDLFHESELKELREAPIGKRLNQVMHHCRTYRENYTASRQTFEKDTASKDAKLQLRRDAYVLQSCLAARACPQRYQKFAKCWQQTPSALVQELQQAGLVHHVCESEREGIERCAASLVSTSVRTATTDDGLNDDDLMAI